MIEQIKDLLTQFEAGLITACELAIQLRERSFGLNLSCNCDRHMITPPNLVRSSNDHR